MQHLNVPWIKGTDAAALLSLQNIRSKWENRIALKLSGGILQLEGPNLQEHLGELVNELEAGGIVVPHEQQTFSVEGMSCAQCALSIERVARTMTGVLDARVNYANAMLEIESVQGTADVQELESRMAKMDYRLVPIAAEDTGVRSDDEEATARIDTLRRRAIAAIVLCIPIVALGMFAMHWQWTQWILWVLSTPVIFFLGRDYFKRALALARNRSIGMDTLVAISSLVAYGTSVAYLILGKQGVDHAKVEPVYFESASVVIAFLLMGKWLEEKTKARTGSALRALMQLHPTSVLREHRDGEYEAIDPARIHEGDVLLARPGDRIGADGVVISGATTIDEQMMTGESMPVFRQMGDWVIGGTVNLDGAIRYRAEKVGASTQLARMVQWVRHAQSTKAPVQRLADRIASVFVPVVLAIASAAFMCWIIADPDQGFAHGLLAFVTVLVVACPCALGLATPTALMAGIGKAARHGILVRDAESLERARRADVVVFDKTGTLTEGQPNLTNVRWYTGEEQIVAKLGALARQSEHPLARSLAASFPGGDFLQKGILSNHPGLGIEWSIGQEHLYLGSECFYEHIRGESAPHDEEISAPGSCVLYFGKTELYARFSFQDRLRPQTKELIGRLKRSGIEPIMLTGDREAEAQRTAQEAGLETWHAGLRPEEKMHIIADLQQQGKRVAMVGDGINDGPALHQADLSIAMGLGTDLAKETANMILLGSDLRKLPVALQLSKMTMQTIRQNLFWAFFYNVVAIPMAAGVLYPKLGIWLTPMMAGAAMAFSSVSVVLNSLRLLYRPL